MRAVESNRGITGAESPLTHLPGRQPSTLINPPSGTLVELWLWSAWITAPHRIARLNWLCKLGRPSTHNAPASASQSVKATGQHRQAQHTTGSCKAANYTIALLGGSELGLTENTSLQHGTPHNPPKSMQSAQRCSPRHAKWITITATTKNPAHACAHSAVYVTNHYAGTWVHVKIWS